MMRRFAFQAAVLLVALALAGCGSGGSTSNSASTLKDLHDPKLAPTATPPARVSTPLAAVAVSGAGGATGSSPDTYVVKSGDTLGKIASDLGVTLDDLLKANPGVSPSALQIGQKLTIPKPGATPAAAGGTPSPFSTPGPAPTAAGAQFPATGGAPSGGGALATAGPGASATSVTGAATTAAGGATEYRVKSGDTACTIAKANNVSVQELAAANGMTKDQIARLQINQLLKVPPGTGHRDC